MIKKLPKEVWAKIQAGEVIDGPASVISELIDNSIDANCKNIKIIVEDTATFKLIIEDDGNGISFEDSFLLFNNHATSKIDKFEDLFELKTLGFRGEALFSIGNVSYVSLKSRYFKEEIGFELVFNGGKRLLHQKIPYSKGTVISIQNLFFNVPVREKFLSDSNKEISNIKQTFLNKTFAAYDISFDLIVGKKNIYNFPFTTNIEERIVQMYPDIEMNMMTYIDKEDFIKKDKQFIDKFQINKIKIICSNRTVYSKYRSFIYFSFNNRSTIDENLLKRIKGFYSSYLPKGFYPYFFMEIEMNPKLIDFNVHPAKKNIKIQNENDFISSILKLLNIKLNEKLASINNYDNEYFITTQDSYIDKQNNKFDFKFDLEKKISEENFFFNKEENNQIYEGNEFIRKELLQNFQGKLKFLGQIFKTYLMFEYLEKLIIIDQHAADERITYNLLMNSINKKRRVLLFPKVIEIKTVDIDKTISLLDNAGIEIIDLGKGKVQIYSIPEIVPDNDEENFIIEINNFINTHNKFEAYEIQQFVKEFYKYIVEKSACHLAIKQKDTLTENDSIRLCEELFKQENFESCPHGRPTLFILNKEDFEKSFLRKK